MRLPPAEIYLKLEDQWDIKNIYHFLSRPFGHDIAVAEVIDFDVLDVVAICDVHLAAEHRACFRATARVVGGCRGLGWRRGRILDGRDVNVLDALARLERSIDFGSGGGWSLVSKGSSRKQVRCSYQQRRLHR